MPHSRYPGHLVKGVVLIALLMFGAVVNVPSTTIGAAPPQIALSKAVVPAGGNLTANGSNFHAGDRAVVSLLSAGSSPNSIRPLATTAAGVGGNGGFSVNVKVPQGTAPGLYPVVAVDKHGNSASQILQVPVQIQVKGGQTPPRAFPVPGLVFSVAGTGFTANEKISLSADFPLYNGNTLKASKTVTADSSGAFAAVNLQVPWMAKDGTVPLTISGATSGKGKAVTATLQISHKPFILLDSSTVSPGQGLSAEAVGFVPNARLTVDTTVARTGAGSARLTKVVRAGNRGMVRFNLSLPRDTSPRAYILTVIDDVTRHHAAARYTVTANAATPSPKTTATAAPKPSATALPAHASIVVAPRSVIPGASAQVLGTGFPANTQVSITASVGRTSAAPQKLSATAKTNGKGAFAATLHIPGDAAAGGYTVTATGGNRSASGTLHIAYLKTAVVSVPPRAIPGTPITVTGFGYSSGATVTVYLSGQTLGTAKATASGTFKAQYTVPGSLSTGMHPLVAQDTAGHKATFTLQVYRHISTHFYFASLFTGPGFQESLLFTNATATNAVVHITYQRQNGPPTYKTITVPAHSRLTHSVNGDLGGNVTAAAVVGADVPIAAERMVMHGSEGSIDPGASNPARSWYFANGNTSHQYYEQIAVQNPTNVSAQVTVQVQPTHSKTYWLHGNLRPQSRASWNLNKTSHDAIGVIVTSNQPVVANRTITIHNGITSKTGVPRPNTHWYFAAGPNQGNTRHWIGVINTTGQSSYMVLQAYDAQGAQVLTVKKWLRPYDRQGFLMNKLAGQTEVAVTVSTTRPSISEQSTFVSGNHNAHTDTFGVTSPQKSAEFAEATTWPHQDNLLGLFNPNAVAIPIVVQFLNTHGGTTQQTYIVAPFAHAYVDVGKVAPNSQLGLLAVSSYPFVALDRQEVGDGAGAMITLGTQS